MKTRSSKNAPQFSPVSLGLWRLHEWEMNRTKLRSYIEACLDAGITTFDHADIYGDYGNEEHFGRILADDPSLRDRMTIVSKTGICLPSESRPDTRIQHYNTSREYIIRSARRSLKKLQTDRLDLLLIHRPDPLMDPEEAAEAFAVLKKSGDILHAGVSNFTPAQFSMLQSRMNEPLVTNQVECSLMHTDPLCGGTLDQAAERSARPMIWSPLAGGRIFHDDSERAHQLRGMLHELALKYDAGNDQIALAWLHTLPCKPITVIGSGRIDRAKAAADAVSIRLDRQDWFALLKASRGHDVA